jgi:hypothetical protein
MEACDLARLNSFFLSGMEHRTFQPVAPVCEHLDLGRHIRHTDRRTKKQKQTVRVGEIVAGFGTKFDEKL